MTGKCLICTEGFHENCYYPHLNLLTSTDWVFNEDGARFAHAQRECVLWVSNGINRLPRVGNTLHGKAIEWANPYVQVYVWLNTTSLTYSMPLKERRSPIMLFSTIISADKLYCWIIVLACTALWATYRKPLFLLKTHMNSIAKFLHALNGLLVSLAQWILEKLIDCSSQCNLNMWEFVSLVSSLLKIHINQTCSMTSTSTGMCSLHNNWKLSVQSLHFTNCFIGALPYQHQTVKASRFHHCTKIWNSWPIEISKMKWTKPKLCPQRKTKKWLVGYSLGTLHLPVFLLSLTNICVEDSTEPFRTAP